MAGQPPQTDKSYAAVPVAGEQTAFAMLMVDASDVRQELAQHAGWLFPSLRRRVQR